jgi:membrane protein DedA with SNARE-associated domain
LHIEMITQDLGLWAYLLLALLVLVEGPIATLAGAIAASSGLMKPEGVFLAAASGNLTADLLWYTLGYLGKLEWLERYGRWVGLTQGMLNRLRIDIEKHVAKVLFIAKLTLGFVIPTLVATGLARVPIRRWLPWLVIGETIWTGALVFLGYFFGKYVQRLERGVEIAAIFGALLSIGFLIYYLGKLRQPGKRKGIYTSLSGGE